MAFLSSCILTFYTFQIREVEEDRLSAIHRVGDGYEPGQTIDLLGSIASFFSNIFAKIVEFFQKIAALFAR